MPKMIVDGFVSQMGIQIAISPKQLRETLELISPTTKRVAKGYEGQFVFLERSKPSQGYCSYDNGEYVILRQTDTMLYGVKPQVGYGSSRVHQFPLTGAQAYSVVDSREDFAEASKLANDMLKWADDVLVRTGHRDWAESVYRDERQNAQDLMRVLSLASS